MSDHQFEEIKLFMPSGQIIAGKWFGNKSIRPILCLHGVEDNAGTFDRLIPKLSNNYSYLAIDLPGHGKSSWIPHGHLYKVVDFLFVIDFLYRHYQWDKISFLTHSISSRLAFLYASLYPNRVDMMISIDVIKPSIYSKEEIKRKFHGSYDRFLVNNKRNQENAEPPSYTITEMIEKIVSGTAGSVTREAAPYLLTRNMIPSKKFPGKFYFARDRRLQSRFGFHVPQEAQLELAEKLTIPFVYIRASNSSYSSTSDLETDEQVIKVLRKHPNFQYYIIESDSHHLHLTEPEKIIPIINEFLEKHRCLKSRL